MEKWNPLNMELRSMVIGNGLRLEQTSTNALKSILRMVKENNKTLGNQSSSLPFKSKIDLLYDLDEINKTEYSHLIKLMEIRNQFAHNPNVTSFKELDSINPDINKYLLKFCPVEVKVEPAIELKLQAAFNELFKQTAGKLLSIAVDYESGIEKEIKKYINNNLIEKFDDIWAKAIERNISSKNLPKELILIEDDNKVLENFHLSFKIVMSEYALAAIDELEEKGLSILKQKETFPERLERRKKSGSKNK